MLINLRNALMAGKRLPYDAEVEYLESTGTQYIPFYTMTGNETSVRFVVDFACSLVGIRVRYIVAPTTTYGPRIFGLTTNSSYTAYNLRMSCDPGGSVGAGRFSANGAWHTVDATFDSNGDITRIYDGTLATYSRTFRVAANGVFVMFGHTDETFVGKISKFQLYIDGVIVRDFVPVRKGTVGYMYDRVTGALFGNAGTGDFVLGQDVVPVEYIESFRGSGGEQYINTGILATTSTKWEIDIAFTITTTGQLMGSGYSENQRFNIGIESNHFRGGFGGGWFTISNTPDTNRHLWRIESLSATQCEASIDGGAAVSYTSTFSPSSAPILLSKRRSTDSSTGTRYYASKIWTSGDLVQNLRPVRVGTEGAMMDVLTRRIYRNAGTGAFTYGNDLKYPIPAS